jgi:hypothetical protein
MTETEANSLKESHLWEAIIRELNYRIMGKLLKMKNCDAEDIRSIQSEIKVYEEIIALPEGVINREQTKGYK